MKTQLSLALSLSPLSSCYLPPIMKGCIAFFAFPFVFFSLHRVDFTIPLPRTPSIVTVLGLGFGGRVEAIPVSADGGSFPSIAGDDSISRIFALPQEKQPLFFMLSRCTNPISDLDETFSRLGNLLPGCTRSVSCPLSPC